VSVKEVICEAIKKKNLLRFQYHKYDRVVEPHLLGQNKANNYVLSAYLVGGFTKSADPRHWRRYLVKDIRFLTKLNQRFERSRKGYNPNDPTMAKIYCRLNRS
jgi:hypothetical protein